MNDALTARPPPPPTKWDIWLKSTIISVVICEYIYLASILGDTEFFEYLVARRTMQTAPLVDDVLQKMLGGTGGRGDGRGDGRTQGPPEWFNKYYYTGERSWLAPGQRPGFRRHHYYNTPLLAAISEGHLGIVNILINELNVDYKKRVKILDPSSVDIGPYETALSYAIIGNNDNQMKIVELLTTKMIENQVSLDSPVRKSGHSRLAENKTALEVAFDVENIPIITLLIENGANLNLGFSSDHGNKYPLDVALAKNMEGIKDLLEGKGALKAPVPVGWWDRALQCVSPAQCGPGPVLQIDNPLEAEPEPEPETERAAIKKYKKKTKKKKSKLHKSKKKSKKRKSKKRKTRRRRS